MARLFKEDWEEVWRGVRVVVALSTLEFINEWAKSSHIVETFANSHGFDPQYVKVCSYICAIIICTLMLMLFEAILRRNEAKIARGRSELKLFERSWAQNCSIKDRPYSLSIIGYSIARGRREYYWCRLRRGFQPSRGMEYSKLVL